MGRQHFYKGFDAEGNEIEIDPEDLKESSMRCVHDWEKVSEEILPSAYEQARQDLDRFKYLNMSPEMFNKKYICILKCTKCGKLDKTIVGSAE